MVAVAGQPDRLSPKAFRNKLLVDADGSPKPFGLNLDDWQAADFEAMDPGWMYMAGLSNEPSTLRAYFERPKGHSKTTDEAVMVTWALHESPRPLVGYAAAGDQDQARLLRDAIAKLVRLNPWLADALSVRDYKITNKHTGSQLEVIASDAAGSHGYLPDFVIVDELTHWRNRDLWDSLFAGAAKRQRCMLAVIANAGTNKGIGWHWTVREMARNSPSWHFCRLEGPVASWISEERLAEQREGLPLTVYNRLWNNVWSAGEGDAISPEDIDAAVTMDGPMESWEIAERAKTGGLGSWTFVAGLDLGITHDHSALVVLGVQYGSPRIRLAECKSWKPPKNGGQVQIAEVEAAVLDAHERFHFRKLLYDPHQAVGTAQSLSRQGILCGQVNFVGRNLDEMATSLLTVFRTRTIDLYPCPELVRDLSRLTIVEKSFGFKLESARTEDGHADTAIALAIALPEARRLSHRRAMGSSPPTTGSIRRDSGRHGVYLGGRA